MGFKEENETLLLEVKKGEREKYEKMLDSQDEAFWDQQLAGMQETPFKNREQLKKEAKEKLLAPFDPKAENVIFDGFALLMDECSHVLSSTEVEELKKELTTIADKLVDGTLVPTIDENVALAQTFQFSNHFLNLVQKMANHYYNKEQFAEAKKLFRLLCEFHPGVTDYWLSLGHTERGLGEDAKATEAYLFAGEVAQNDPFPYLLATYVNLKEDKPAAKGYFNTAKEIIAATGNKQYTDEVSALEQELR